MSEKTCAACDCRLEGEVIKVKVAGKAAEVCCEDCAKALKESQVSPASSKQED
jgi:hypothetical protein